MKNQLIQEEQLLVNNTIQEIGKIVQVLQEMKRRPESASEAHNEDVRRSKLDKYTDAKDEPYIGKLEILEGDQEQTYRIGKIGIVDNDYVDLIYDWRTPFGDSYYGFNGGEGELYYESPDGKQQIVISKKRTVHILKGNVTDVKDFISNRYRGEIPEEIPEVNDPMLQRLWQERNSDHQLREIIATIQKEQNEIIRLGITQPILVQGVAGSGKTSIALHRVSYMLYHYQKTLSAGNILVLAPNRIFLNYMRDIVKDLDMEGIQQSTISEFAIRAVPSIKSIRGPQHWLNLFLNEPQQETEFGEALRYKSSIRFYTLLTDYLAIVADQLMPTALPELTDFSPEPLEIQHIFREIYQGYRYLPLNKRREATIESILNWSKLELSKQQKYLEEKYLQFKREWTLEIHDSIALKKETESKLNELMLLKLDLQKANWQKNIKEYLDLWKPIQPYDVYAAVSSKEKLLDLDPEIGEEVAGSIESLSKQISQQSIGYEDIAPLLLLESQINGIQLTYDYMVIDEVQDYSPFLIKMLRQFTKSMTMLGDVTQSIYGWTGFTEWDPLDEVFEGQLRRLDLTVSYRSTVEVMQVANQILQNSQVHAPQIHPVNRHGDVPAFIKVEGYEDLLQKLSDSIVALSLKGHRKIAVITKDARVCSAFYNKVRLNEGLTKQYIENPEQELNAQVTFIPAALVKGLEFDAVIVPNTFGASEIDAKLLFVAVTRAQEDLNMLYFANPGPLLQNYYVE